MAAFAERGLSNTRQRRLIAECLAELSATQDDFATEELWRSLQQRDPQLGRATVFRAVDVLVERGVLDRIAFADGAHRYHVCSRSSHHHHLTCTQCHRVVEVEACLPVPVLEAVARAHHFSLEGHAVELFGRCPDCRALPAPTPVEAHTVG